MLQFHILLVVAIVNHHDDEIKIFQTFSASVSNIIGCEKEFNL